MPDTPAPETNVAPNLESELDAALSKSFPGFLPQSQEKGEPVEKPEPAPEPEAKKEPKVEVKDPPAPKQEPKAQVKEEPKKEKVEVDKPLMTDEEIDKADPKQQNSWTALKNNNKRSRRLLEQKEQEIDKLKTVVAEKSSTSQKEVEELKKKIGDLEKYRAMIDIQADPEFVSKYDEPIAKAKEAAKAILINLKASKETVDAMDFRNTELLDQLVGLISQKDRFTAQKLERKFKEILDLSDSRDEMLSEHQKNYKQTIEQKRKEHFEKETESEGRMLKHVENILLEKREGKPRIPFLTKLEANDTGTQAEMDQVAKHNSMVDMLHEKLQSVLKMKEPEQRAEVAIAAVSSHYFLSQINVLTKQLNEAREELKKVAAVQSESPVKKPSAPRATNGELETTDAALNSFFSRRR